MLRQFKYALFAGVLLSLSPVAFADTPADTLVIAINLDDMLTLDPAEAYEFSGIEIIANSYDRIMRFEPTDISKLAPGVAESYTVSDDGKTLTFPTALRLGPLLFRCAGEDNERESLLLRSGRRKGPVLRSKAKQDGIDEGALPAKSPPGSRARTIAQGLQDQSQNFIHSIQYFIILKPDDTVSLRFQKTCSTIVIG